MCAAQFFVTNAFGDSQSTQQTYTQGAETGLRTLSGGQFSLQVAGTLATQQNATPPFFVQATHAVRDVRATLNQAANGYSVGIEILQNGVTYCNLMIASGSTASNVLDGLTLPPLVEGGILTMNIVLNVNQIVQGSTTPGRDLSVSIRF